MSWFSQNAPNPNALPSASNTGVAGGGGGKFAGMDPQQVWQQALTDMGIQKGQGGQYRGKMQPILDYIKQNGGGDWQQGGSKADDWLKDPTGHEWDAISSGGDFQFIPDYTNTGGGPAGAGGPGGDPNAYLSDPSYQFTFNQALQGAQRNAAAKGISATGGFQKALAGYAAGLASQGYDAQFKRLLGMSNLGAQEANEQAASDRGYANAVANAQEGGANAAAAGSVAQGNVWGAVPEQAAQAYNFYHMFGPGSKPVAGPYDYSDQTYGMTS